MNQNGSQNDMDWVTRIPKNRYPQHGLSRPMAQGYTYEDIEQGKHLKVLDHLRNRYKSKAAMAEVHEINRSLFVKREEAERSLKKARTTLAYSTREQRINNGL